MAQVVLLRQRLRTPPGIVTFADNALASFDASAAELLTERMSGFPDRVKEVAPS